MTTANKDKTTITANEITITRLFDAPVALVWRAWTDEKHFQRWWGPKEFSSRVITMDFRVGGKYHWCMRSPSGPAFYTTGVYREIVPQQRIAYSDSLADEQGNPVSPSHYGMPGDAVIEALVTVDFEERGGKTLMTLRHFGVPAGEMSEMTSSVWNEAFDKLAISLQQL